MEKTIVFGNDGGSQNNLLASLIPSLLQRQGIDQNLLAMNGGMGGFGNGNFLWMLFVLFFCRGWGGNGFGGGDTGFLANQLNNDAGRDLLMQAINGNRDALNALAQQFNCSVGQIQQSFNALMTQVQGVGNQVGLSVPQIINAIQSGNATLASQLAECCCENRLAICQQTNTLQQSINGVAVGQERGFSNLGFETQKQTCAIEKSIADSTEKILAGQRSAEMREMQNKIDALREENGTFKSNIATSQIVGQAVAPINAVLATLKSDVDAIKCNAPEVAKVPYSPVVGVPNCVAAQYGLYGGYPFANTGFWG